MNNSCYGTAGNISALPSLLVPGQRKLASDADTDHDTACGAESEEASMSRRLLGRSITGLKSLVCQGPCASNALLAQAFND